MKRLFVIITTLIFISINSNSQNKGFARWSITPEVGISYFDGDITQRISNVFPKSASTVAYGLNLEYAMSPIWGLGLSGHYLPVRAENNSPVALKVNTEMYSSDINFNINITRLIFPNTKSRLYMLSSFGLGAAYYTFDVRYKNNEKIPYNAIYTDQKYNGQTRPICLYDGTQPMKYGIAVSIPVTMSLEYNISRPLAIGARASYHVFTKDNLEGVTYLNWDGISNDFLATGTVYFRVKFNSRHKDHLRNIPYEQFAPDQGYLLAKDLEGKFNKLNQRVDGMDKRIDSLDMRVTKLEDLLAVDGPDKDGDGVPDVRDKDNNTPANTPVDFWGRTMPMGQYNSGYGYQPNGTGGANGTMSGNGASGNAAYNSNGAGAANNPYYRNGANGYPGGNNGAYPNGGATNGAYYTSGSVSVGPGGSVKPGKYPAINIMDECPSIYFDYDRIELDDVSLIVVGKIAEKMKRDPQLFVEVRGYCDYTGTTPYNNLLSQRRSDKVKNELVRLWGIPADHIISNGKGRIIEPRMKFKPNRRCDFFFAHL